MGETTPLQQARKELQEEDFRAKVDLEKSRIRKIDKDRRWWHVLFPWKIKLEKRNEQ
jgi:hypothetical protein